MRRSAAKSSKLPPVLVLCTVFGSSRDPCQIEGKADEANLRYRSQPTERNDLPSGYRVHVAPTADFGGSRSNAVALTEKGTLETGCLFLFH